MVEVGVIKCMVSATLKEISKPSKNSIKKIELLYNFKLSEFRYTYDYDSFRHILKRHSKENKKLRADEIPILESNFDEIRFYIENSIELVGAGNSRSRNLKTFMHIFEKEDVKTYVVFEILQKQKEFRLKTMYKNKKHFYQQGS